jgi:metallo-beta-lactamase family protein
VDHLIVESTYGDRERPVMNGEQRRGLLAGEINDAHAAGGPVLIPAFAVERSQELLSDLLILMDERRIPQTDIFLDSPLAIEATEVFQSRGWNRETGVNPFARLRENQRLRFLREPSESDQLERLSGWHIVIAASGMCDAGRVRRHLKSLLWRTQATVLLSGYQAVGTLGRYLQEGARRVSIQGDDIQVRARIRSLDVYSGHADANGLVAWAKSRGPVRGRTFLAHGEPQALAGLRDRLVAAGGATEAIITPELDQSFSISGTLVETQSGRRARIKADAAAKADWHNARAQFLMSLNDRLEQAPDDKAREQLIARMSALLPASDG